MKNRKLTKAGLEFIGGVFTETWVKNQDNKRLILFETSAEKCRTMINKFYNRSLIGSILITMGTIGFLLTLFAVLEQAPNAILYGVFGVLATISGILTKLSMRGLCPGKTHMNVRLAWMDTRKFMIKSGIAESIGKILKLEKHPDRRKTERMLESEIRTKLGLTIRKIKIREAEGLPKKDLDTEKTLIIRAIRELGFKKPDLKILFETC